MSDSARVTRRQFLTSTVATAGIITVAHHLPAAQLAQDPAGDAAVERAMPHRIDGLPKVKGEKVYARDLRARDMAGWPPETRHALLLRADHSDRPFLGVDVSSLSPDAPPKRVVTAEDLTRDRIMASEHFGKYLLVPKGRTAEHAGQPVAILIFDSFRQWWTARQKATPRASCATGRLATRPRETTSSGPCITSAPPGRRTTCSRA